MRGQPPVNPLVEALDLNKDGVIDAEEIAKATESLKKLDKNGDGKLTAEEFRPSRSQGPGRLEGLGGDRRHGNPEPQSEPGGENHPPRPTPEE